MLPQRKNEISSLPQSHNGSGPHRREELSPAFVELHLQWSYPLAADFPLLDCDRFCHGKDCPESRICFKVETVTRTERDSRGKDEIPDDATGVALIAEKSIHWLLLNSTSNELSACLVSWFFTPRL